MIQILQNNKNRGRPSQNRAGLASFNFFGQKSGRWRPLFEIDVLYFSAKNRAASSILASSIKKRCSLFLSSRQQTSCIQKVFGLVEPFLRDALGTLFLALSFYYVKDNFAASSTKLNFYIDNFVNFGRKIYPMFVISQIVRLCFCKPFSKVFFTPFNFNFELKNFSCKTAYAILRVKYKASLIPKIRRIL